MVNFEGFWHLHRSNYLSSSSLRGDSCGKGGLNSWFLFLECLAGASWAIRSLFPKNWACILIFLLVHWESSVGSGYFSCLLGLKWLPGLGLQNPFIFVLFLTGFKCSGNLSGHWLTAEIINTQKFQAKWEELPKGKI